MRSAFGVLSAAVLGIGALTADVSPATASPAEALARQV
jgi:hypothetical protein